MNKFSSFLQNEMVVASIGGVVLIAAVLWLIFVAAAVIRLIAKRSRKNHWTNEIEWRDKKTLMQRFPN